MKYNPSFATYFITLRDSLESSVPPTVSKTRSTPSKENNGYNFFPLVMTILSIMTYYVDDFLQIQITFYTLMPRDLTYDDSLCSPL